MKKVFIYVGHSNWGKSRALKILTGDNSHQKTVQIKNYNVRVRKMSNDDDGIGLYNWVQTFQKQSYERFIIAFCPKLAPVVGQATVEQDNSLNILIHLQKTNDLFFFVQKEMFNSSNNKISLQEINWLKTFGKVYVLKNQNNDIVRASEFLKFINLNI